jgi:glycine/D-amino acid oxidase-like deaminating enzyme
MYNNRSPWIHQLNKNRVSVALHGDLTTDIAIVGGGIAGIATAFFCLKYTNKKVTLIEGGRLAHGATGHNGGQLTTYFERPLTELVEEFGSILATEGQRSVDSAWDLLDEMYKDAHLTIPLAKFIGHAGIATFPRVLLHLEEAKIRKEYGLIQEEFLISKDATFLSQIPKHFDDLYSIVPQEKILERLEVDDNRFVACMSAPKGCMNSALFCERIVEYLQQTYPKRFSFYEHTFVRKVVLKDAEALLDVGNAVVTTGTVVLCTNGFENFTIINSSGLEINSRFHHSVFGLVGYLSAYLTDSTKAPTALSYIISPDLTINNPYFYVTRRQFDVSRGESMNLVSIGGGSVYMLEDSAMYKKDFDYVHDAEEEIEEFVRTVFDPSGEETREYHFRWHGLMGFTQNGVRLIGVDPRHNSLFYNLGCNGVGLMPSIFGGRRIARILSGEKVEDSIFDPIHMEKNK